MAQVEKQNILFIMTDQLRWDGLNCYGNEVVETPNIDEIASDGSLFENAYSPSPSCIPARACLISGMDQWHTGLLGMGKGQGKMGVNFPNTLPGELAKAGYHTQGIGKMHFSPQRALNGFHHVLLDESGRVEEKGFVSDYKQWFDQNKTGDYDIIDHGINWNSWMARPYSLPEHLHPTNWTANRSIRFLEQRDPTKPFFLMTSFARPHSPYDPPDYYFQMYQNKTLPKPFLGEWSSTHDQPKDGAQNDAWRGKRSDEEINRARVGYYGLISHIDHQIGKLITYLKRNGLYDDTLLVFASDHGDMLGDHHLWRKTYAYEGSAHIPLIIRIPNIKQKEKITQPVSLYDVMPTLLDIVNHPIPESTDGQSTFALIKDQKIEWRKYVHGEHSTCYSEEQEMQYITDGKYKYIWFPRLGTEQFFHLEKDPKEEKDLSKQSSYQNALKRYQGYLIEELKKRDVGLVENNELISQKDKPFIQSPYYEKRTKNHD